MKYETQRIALLYFAGALGLFSIVPIAAITAMPPIACAPRRASVHPQPTSRSVCVRAVVKPSSRGGWRPRRPGWV